MEKENHYFIASQDILERVVGGFERWCGEKDFSCFSHEGIMNYANIINSGVTFSYCMFNDECQMAFLAAWKTMEGVEVTFKTIQFELLENVSVPNLQALFKAMREYCQDDAVDDMMCKLLSSKMTNLDRKTIYYHAYRDGLTGFVLTKHEEEHTQYIMPRMLYSVRLRYDTIVKGEVYARNKEEALEILKRKYDNGLALDEGLVKEKNEPIEESVTYISSEIATTS